jgi:hypothetical protein
MNRNKLCFAFLPIVLIPFFLNSCKSPTSPELIINEIKSPPVITGIVITDETGEQVGVFGYPNERESLPSNKYFRLDAPYPNPTYPSLKIDYAVPMKSNISFWVVKGTASVEIINNMAYYFNCQIFNSSNNYAIKLFEGVKDPGYYEISFDGKDKYGNILPDGFYRIYEDVNGELMWRNLMILNSEGPEG